MSRVTAAFLIPLLCLGGAGAASEAPVRLACAMRDDVPYCQPGIAAKAAQDIGQTVSVLRRPKLERPADFDPKGAEVVLFFDIDADGRMVPGSDRLGAPIAADTPEQADWLLQATVQAVADSHFRVPVLDGEPQPVLGAALRMRFVEGKSRDAAR